MIPEKWSWFSARQTWSAGVEIVPDKTVFRACAQLTLARQSESVGSDTSVGGLQ
jgi:hypothetical protein